MTEHIAVFAPDIADDVINRIAIERFNRAVTTAVENGDLPAPLWDAF